jgi:CheY-like chemotaxis protein
VIRALVVEDGTEYVDTLRRFLSDGFSWERASSGPEALAMLAAGEFSVVFLDMRFDRCPSDQLLGSLEEAIDRFNGDVLQARRFLEDHQGNYILAAFRARGLAVPVLLSFDFANEPRRWDRIKARYAPVEYLPGNAEPGEIAARLRRMAG